MSNTQRQLVPTAVLRFGSSSLMLNVLPIQIFLFYHLIVGKKYKMWIFSFITLFFLSVLGPRTNVLPRYRHAAANPSYCHKKTAFMNVYKLLKYLNIVWNSSVTMGWTVRWSNPAGDEIFRTCPDRPWGPPSLLYYGYRFFPGGTAAGVWLWIPTSI
jgi:hypothetical protein